MLVYKAMYQFLDNGVHAEVLDFPGVISWGPDLNEARRLLSSALVDIAELTIERGEPLPLAAVSYRSLILRRCRSTGD